MLLILWSIGWFVLSLLLLLLLFWVISYEDLTQTLERRIANRASFWPWAFTTTGWWNTQLKMSTNQQILPFLNNFKLQTSIGWTLEKWSMMLSPKNGHSVVEASSSNGSQPTRLFCLEYLLTRLLHLIACLWWLFGVCNITLVASWSLFWSRKWSSILFVLCPSVFPFVCIWNTFFWWFCWWSRWTVHDLGMIWSWESWKKTLPGARSSCQMASHVDYARRLRWTPGLVTCAWVRHCWELLGVSKFDEKWQKCNFPSNCEPQTQQSGHMTYQLQ